WGGSAIWDPVRRQVRWVGKRDGGTYSYHHIIYDEIRNTWEKQLASPSFPTWGHGYDHNAVDSATGTSYFRPFNEPDVYKWDGATWQPLPQLTRRLDIVGSLSWFDGLGLVY